jgi:glycosyltransferase involved in cell wall biosynthesis
MRESKPLVSIGVPIYNGESFVRRALDALLAQDYENFEIIISDNASTDNTREICQEYAARDPRIKLHANEQNLGARVNFEIVVELAQGKYFMWAAVDDGWHPTFVSTLVEELESHPEAGTAMCAIDLVNEDGLLIDTVRFGGADSPNRKTHFQMFLWFTSPTRKKNNVFIYGLFRRELIQNTFPLLPPLGPPLEYILTDRTFLSLIALITRYRYVDRVLHTRQIQTVKLKAGGGWREIAGTRTLGTAVWHSKLVPWHRKLYIPVGVASYTLRIMHARYRVFIKPKIAYCWRRLRELRWGINAN